MTKRKAFLTHVCVSALIVGSFLLVVLLIWYPWMYIDVSGAKKIILMLVTVDLILGPCLTLIVFKPGKPGLLLDLTVIIGIQLAAFIYGATTLYRERPAYIVFTVDRFEVVTASEVDDSRLRHEELRHRPFGGPQLVFAKKPTDRAKAQEILFGVLFERQPDIDRRPELYEPYEQFTDKVLKRALDQADLVSQSDRTRERFARFLQAEGGDARDYAYLPLVGKSDDAVIAVSKEQARPVATIDVNPWVRTAAQKARNS